MSVLASPCVNICRMDADNVLCTGCYRTLDEIARWSGAADSDKRAILAAVDKRRAEHEGQPAPGHDCHVDCKR